MNCRVISPGLPYPTERWSYLRRSQSEYSSGRTKEIAHLSMSCSTFCRHVCMCMHMHTHTHTHMCVCVRICDTHMCVCVRICVRVRVRVRTLMCVCV